ncbi:MAG: hypothetical protein AB7J32_11960 [Pseudonocardia sp.]
MWEPVGPLPAVVYRRRRWAAGLGALAVGVVVLLLVLLVGGGEPEPAPPPPPAEPVSAPVPVGPPECSDQMIKLTAEIDQPEHHVGQQVVLRLVVTDTAAQPCARDLDPARQEVMIVTADLKTQVWSSNDCENPSTLDLRTLQPNQPLGFRAPWNGKSSNPGCTEERVQVPPGDYKLVTRLDDVYSEPVAFTRLP